MRVGQPASRPLRRSCAGSNSPVPPTKLCMASVRWLRHSTSSLPRGRRPMMREIVRQQAGQREIVERRDHQALGEIAVGAEDHDGAGPGLGGLRRDWRRRRRRVGRGSAIVHGSRSGLRRCSALAGLDMAAEAEAHRGQQLLAERVVLARAEAGEQRGGQHVGRHRFLDRRLDGPAALAGIRDMAGEIREVGLLGQRDRGEVEQPGGHHAAAPPDLGDVGEVEVEALVGRQIGRVLVLEDVEALGIGLHQAVFDAVVDHLDEVAGAGRPGMDIALLGAVVGELVAAAACGRCRRCPAPGS